MRITRNRGLLVLAGFLLVGGLASCAPTPDAAEKEPELDSASQEQDYDDWQLAFEKCMDGQGVDLSQFMTKASDGGDAGADEPAPEPPSDADIAAMEDAQEFCMEEVGDPPTRDDLPSDEKLNEMNLLFAKCMRDAGYDYPDPEQGPSGAVAAMPQGDFDPADVDACVEAAGYPGANG